MGFMWGGKKQTKKKKKKKTYSLKIWGLLQNKPKKTYLQEKFENLETSWNRYTTEKELYTCTYGF